MDMNPYKKFSVICMAFVGTLVLFNAVIWHGYTKQLLTREGGVMVGDLARMGYLPNHVDRRLNDVDLPRRHFEINEFAGQPVDVITLGDSFSHGLGLGKNRYYQDYLATFSNLSVLNLHPYAGGKNYLEVISILLNSGYLDELHPRYVLLEMVERSCISRLDDPVDFAITDSPERVKDFYQKGIAVFNNTGSLPPAGYFNSGNLKFVLYTLGYLFSDHALTGQVYRVPLRQVLFSGDHGDELLFLNKELRKSSSVTPEIMTKINDNLNQLARRLKTRDIELIFMPPPNKYTLYRRFFADESYPQSRFFEELRSLPKEYHFIDTKEILDRELDRGEMDIYYKDDTHWSWKASRAIFEQVRFP
jgi:hypothetical protein